MTQKGVKLNLALALVAFCLTCILGCNPPGFPGGIRVHATEVLVQTPGATLDVSGVFDFGSDLLDREPHNGSQTEFSGVTGAFGLDDHPLARTNATWQVSVDYSGVIPQCGTAHVVDDVPIEGATFNAVCFI